MSYSTGEDLIQTRVIACDNFDSNNVARGNWKLMNKGRSDHYAILRPGPFTIEWNTYRSYIATWTTIVELWQRYTDDEVTRTNLFARVADLLPIMAYPRLGDTGGTVLDAHFTGGGEPQEMWKKGGGPQWLRWEMQIEWKEEVTVNIAG